MKRHHGSRDHTDRDSAGWKAVLVGLGAVNAFQAVVLAVFVFGHSRPAPDTTVAENAVDKNLKIASTSMSDESNAPPEHSENKRHRSPRESSGPHAWQDLGRVLAKRFNELDCGDILALEDPSLVKSKIDERLAETRHALREQFEARLVDSVTELGNPTAEQIQRIRETSRVYYQAMDELHEVMAKDEETYREQLPGAEERVADLKKRRESAIAEVLGKKLARTTITDALRQTVSDPTQAHR